MIREMFASRGPAHGRRTTCARRWCRSARTVIPQTRGTAPGLICPVRSASVEKVVYAVPGVPHEMREMFERAVLPDLHRRSGDAVGDRQPGAAHVGRERERAQRAARRRDRRARRARQPDAGVPRQRMGRAQGPADGQGGDAGGRGGVVLDEWDGRGPRRSSASTCSASTTTRWSRSCSRCCASAG